MDAVEEVKSRLSIEDVVSEYVQLKRAGRNFKGLSPFSNEKTPSFMVSPEKQIWHDFSSGKGGNMFSFVMEVEGLEFKGALELLARKANVDLEQYRTSSGGGNSKLKERLYQALETSTKFYQVHLSKNNSALEYVRTKREFSKETLLKFRLGYSPNNGTALVDYLKKQGFSEQEIQKAGLATKRYQNMNDMFRGRLMIPLMDPQGQVVGFTARLLEDIPDAPKYINTPSTLLYDKSRHAYGLNFAKEAMRKENFVVVAEGNLDVIASHQAGVNQVVATAGTAMTEQQFKLLARFTHDVRLAFDEDNAGRAATERVIPIASKLGISLSVISIPSGKDPDELIRQDAKLWEQVIAKQQYALDWLMNRYKSQLDLESAQGKRQFSDILLPVVSQLSDEVEKDHYIEKLAKLLGVSKEALITKLNRGDKASPAKSLKKTAPSSKPDPNLTERKKTQDQLLSIVQNRVAFASYLDNISEDMFVTEPAKKLFKIINNSEALKASQVDKVQGDGEQRTESYNVYDEGVAEPATQQFASNTDKGSGSASPPDGELRGFSDYDRILELLYEALYQDLDDVELGYEASRLQARLIEQHVKAKKIQITEALRTADETQQQVLLGQAKALDSLLSTRP